MGWVQQISLQFVGTEDSRLSAPPGNPKIWEILSQKVGPFICRRRQSLLLEWETQPDQKILNSLDFHSIFKMKGLFDVKVGDSNPHVVFQVKRKGRNGEPLVSLFTDWISLQKIPQTPRVTLVREFVFNGVDALGNDIPFDPAQVPLWIQALESLAAMGAKSGIYFPESEEIRILKPGPWPSSPPDWNLPVNAQTLGNFIDQSLKEGLWSFVRRSYKVGIHKPRSKTPYHSRNPKLLDKTSQVQDHVALIDEPLSKTMGPLNLLVSHPIRSDGYSSLEKFRYRCESYASLVDAPLGLAVFRTPSSGPLMIEPLNSLPVKTEFLKKSFVRILTEKPDADLALIGLVGFDSRNPIMWRRVQEFFIKITKNSNLRKCEHVEIWEGSQNWVPLLFSTLRSLGVSGWSLDVKNGLNSWFKTNEQKCRFNQSIMFWCETSHVNDLQKIAQSQGLEIALLGSKKESIDGVEITNSGQQLFARAWATLGTELNVFLRTTEIGFTEQDLKSPTYGFDRPAHFPDEYMVKASLRDSLEPKWNQEFHRIYSGKDFRSVLVRGEGSLVIPAFRWVEGSKIIAESWGGREGWLDVNPFESGRATVDSAIRWLVSMGAEPTEAIAKIWTPSPEDFDPSTHAIDELKAQTLLAVEGILDACEAFQLCPRQWNFEGASNPSMKNELFVGLRKELPKKGVVTFPGFRMLGEVLFMVGPKPAFMDGGSRVLHHISRVFSNHVTILDYANQIELYRLVHSFLLKGIITCIRPINEAGLISTIGEMALWGGMGAQIRPTVSTIELFSGSPGRFLVGVLPQEAKKFESSFKGEQIIQVGVTGGEKIFGLPLQKLQESRLKGEFV